MDENKEEKPELKIYELGFLIVPTVAEEKLPETFSNIKAVIENEGGLFITEEYPKLRALSYPMAKKVDVQKTIFKQAYFGWLKFEIDSAKLSKIKESLEGDINILRFILVRTVRENTLASDKIFAKKEKIIYRRPEVEIETAPVSQEELDKSIDELVSG